ncbi:MAG: winged helix DNA-binding domain-containing protein [Micromonosporaceae bacterium]
MAVAYGGPMADPVLTRRALNRATLARQLLLGRSDLSVADAVEHLVGLQAQTPHTWYVGLWSRLLDAPAPAVSDLLGQRRLVRLALMRSTIHLVTARDAVALRPHVQPVLERGLQGNFGRHLVGLDRDALVAAGRELVEEHPLTFSQLGGRLAVRFPDRDPAALAQAVRAWVPLVQVPPRGQWGRAGPAAHTTVESWLADQPRRDQTIDDMVLRYLAAFGPASVRDLRTWSGLTGLGDVVGRLRSRLVAFRDEAGVALIDLPDAPRPDPDAPAPPRFLYDFDNLLLSHADRSRVISVPHQQQGRGPDGTMPRFVLVDGFTAGTWTTATATGRDSRATLIIQPFGRLSTADRAALAVEGQALLRFLTPETGETDVVIRPAADG